MHPIKQRIFLKLIIPFAGGMLTAYASKINFSIWLTIPALFLLATIYYLIHKKYLFTIRYGWVYGLVVNLFLFIAGLTLFSNEYDLHKSNHFINYKNDKYLIIKINEPPVFKEKFVRCIIKTEKAGSKNDFHNASGNAVVYFSNNITSLNFKYGDLVLIKNKPSELDAPSIPYQYDYKGYLDKRNIHFTFFPKENDFISLNENHGLFLLRIAYKLRDWCVACVKKYVADKKEAAVVSALTVGYRDEISQDVVQSYSSAGVIHILAVSGMHVGLLYLLLEFLLKFLNRNATTKIIKVIIILCLIWLFAMITGLGGSIVRASAMISLLIVGRNLKRRMDIIDSLCSSAFLILLISPFTLIDAGFQLSFSALVGIALWERNFSQLIEWQNPLLHFIWQMCSVSMAAQLGVLPLTLFYFNQFPLLFLIANVVGVPLSTGILYGGLVLFILAPFAGISEQIGTILRISTHLLDGYINWVQSFSFSTINIPSFGIISLLLTTLSLIFFASFIENKIPRKILYSLSAMMIVIFINTISNIEYLKKRELLFLHFGKGNLYVFREKNNALMLADDSLLKDNYFSQYTSSFIKHTPVSNLQVIPISSINDTSSLSWKKFHSYGRFISFYGLKGLLINPSIQKTNNTMKLDFIIGKISSLKQPHLVSEIKPTNWIADSDVKNFNYKALKNECASLSLPLHYLPIDGPWIKEF